MFVKIVAKWKGVPQISGINYSTQNRKLYWNVVEVDASISKEECFEIIKGKLVY